MKSGNLNCGEKWIIKFPVHTGYINNKATVTAAILRPKTVSASYEHNTNFTTSYILVNFRKASHYRLPAYITDLLFFIYFFLYFSDLKLSCMLTIICSCVSLKLSTLTLSCIWTCIIRWSLYITSYATYSQSPHKYLLERDDQLLDELWMKQCRAVTKPGPKRKGQVQCPAKLCRM